MLTKAQSCTDDLQIDYIFVYIYWNENSLLKAGIHGPLCQLCFVWDYIWRIGLQMMPPNHACTKSMNQRETDHMKRVPYTLAIWSIKCDQVCTHPDLAFTARMFGGYHSNLGFDHWKAVKKTLLHYLQGTKDFTLTYKKSNNLEVMGYSDADYNGHLDSIKSTSENLFTLYQEELFRGRALNKVLPQHLWCMHNS